MHSLKKWQSSKRPTCISRISYIQQLDSKLEISTISPTAFILSRDIFSMAPFLISSFFSFQYNYSLTFLSFTMAKLSWWWSCKLECLFLPLAGFVFGSPEFFGSIHDVNSQLLASLLRCGHLKYMFYFQVSSSCKLQTQTQLAFHVNLSVLVFSSSAFSFLSD